MALTGDEARELSRNLIDRYFRTLSYPYTRHHIDSYDQFLQQDLTNIIKAQSPILIFKELLDEKTNTYKYKVEIFVGGVDGTAIEIGTPTISLQNTEEVRLLYPNEARLRNVSYASTVYADIIVKITYTIRDGSEFKESSLSPSEETFKKWPLFKIPIMLHSRYCILHNKPKEFLREVGECPYDNGGYFIVEGSEKILITRQEQAFNTLYISAPTDDKLALYASIQCLSEKTRQVKRINFMMMKLVEKENITQYPTIHVSLPFVRKPIPLFVLFRAIGFQSDEEIIKFIFTDFESSEAKLLLPKLQPSIIEAFPFLNTYTAIQYIKTLTKGFSEAHVLDIVKNQLFTHMPNDPTSQAIFLGDCVRKMLRVSEGYDNITDRDDLRNQRCLTSGFLIQELFNNSYNLWRKMMTLAIDTEYNTHKATLYRDENFQNIFQVGNGSRIFAANMLTDMIMKGFKGKWGTGLGEEKTGALQSLSRLSYVDFMSHCRRVILDFDTNKKLTGPRKLHTSQYGYFCTSETPTGASIGITKNLSIMTAISTASQTDAFFQWLREKANVQESKYVTEQERILFIPIYINGGMFGYIADAEAQQLVTVLKLLKRTGCLPYSVSISFSYRERTIYIYMDAGRPLRPLIWLNESANDRVPVTKLSSYPNWRALVMGNLKIREYANLETTEFVDPIKEKRTLKQYEEALRPHTGAIEYIDPYEQNESFIANNPAYITPETTHMEVHPSTIMSMMTSLIPFAPHNQSPRNQLSCSQSKQGLSVYATNWRNRFDNTAHVLCYPEMPLTRTMYNNYLGEGKLGYGMNCILAIACWSGYNQEDGIVMNYDALQRGMFRSMAFRSYQAFEEDDEKAGVKVRFGNPALIGNWHDLKPGLDYSKLDERGIIQEGAYVDETTVIVGAYMMSMTGGQINDASTTPQVWTRGRVEKVVVMVNNMGLRLVKIRVVQDRIPELGDKFSNRHGQKGTIGALLRGHDMPRTESGIVPDMIMNPHAIPSRMTIAQNLEQLLGKTAALSGAIGDGTSFMNDGSPQEAIGHILEEVGFEKYGNEVLYNGATGEQIQAAIFIGPVYGMRLKHMVEDKWQARGKGRKEMRTHQPTGGRGAQGGLKIGEMDRDSIIGHGITSFVKESFMERSDGTSIPICVACGTIPIYNPRLKIAICPMCDGPVRFMGDNVHNLEILPPLGRPKSRIVEVEMPYSTKLLTQEQETYLNLSMRFITTSGVTRLSPLEYSGTSSEVVKELQRLNLPEVVAPAYIDSVPKAVLSVEELRSMNASLQQLTEEEKHALDNVLDETVEGQLMEQNAELQGMQAQESVPVIQVPMGPNMDMQANAALQANVALQANEIIQPAGPMMPSPAPMMQPPPPMMQPPPPMIQPSPPMMQGGMQLPAFSATVMPGEGRVQGPAVPGMGPIINVSTAPEAFERDGIAPQGFGSRPIRRNQYRYGGGMSGMGGMGSMGSMGPMTDRYTPSPMSESVPSSNMPLRVNKLME